LAPDVFAQHYLPWFGRFLHARRSINPVTIKVAIGAHGHICDMNANPQIMRASGCG